MNKKNVIFLAIVLGTISAMLTVACNKESEPDTLSSKDGSAQIETDSNANTLLSIHISNCGDDDYYYLKDLDSCLWNWRSFRDGDFFFDIDVFSESPDSAIQSISVVDSNTIYVEYTSGSDVYLRHVTSNGCNTTFSIMADNDSTVQISMIFPQGVNFIKLMETHGNADAKIAPVVIYAAACLAVTIYEGVQYIKCENSKKDFAQSCKYHHCLPKIYSGGVDCSCDPQFNHTSDYCNHFDYWCK